MMNQLYSAFIFLQKRHACADTAKRIFLHCPWTWLSSNYLPLTKYRFPVDNWGFQVKQIHLANHLQGPRLTVELSTVITMDKPHKRSTQSTTFSNYIFNCMIIYWCDGKVMHNYSNLVVTLFPAPIEGSWNCHIILLQCTVHYCPQSVFLFIFICINHKSWS